MSENFDPYHQWLGIPAGEQPPDHYRLLSIPPFEADPAVIENAANQRMAHLRTFQTGRHVAQSQQLLNEVAAARVCLLNPAKKTAYDQSLRQRAAVRSTPADAPQADALDPGLAAILQTRKAGTTAIAAQGRGKKSQPKPVALIASAAATVAALGLLGLWWLIARDTTPSDRETAKIADSATSIRPPKQVSPKFPESAKKDNPLVASTEPNGELPSDVPKAVADPKPPEPKAAEEPDPAPLPDKIAAVKPATDDSATEQPAPVKKLAPPSSEEQKRLTAEIDEVYKPSEAKTQAAKAALARKLLEDGRKNEANRAEQFVLLRRAGEIAREAGEADLMLEAVDAIAAAGFGIRPFAAKAAWLKRLVEQAAAGGAGQLAAVCESCVKFALAAAAGGAIDEASEVLDAASKSLAKPLTQAQTAQRAARANLARAPRADKAERQKKVDEAQEDFETLKSAQSALAECSKALQKAVRERETVQAARERLKTAPDDPEACLTVGRWCCFQQGDWDEGLKLLAKSSDAGLKALAAEELASKPATADDKVARGDAWWNLAEKAAGKPKAAMRRRAGQWYGDALPELSPGLAKTKVEGRLAQVPAVETPDAPASTARPPLAKAPFDERTAHAHQSRWARYLRVPVVETNSLGMKLAIIPPGEFEMGSPKELIEEEAKTYASDQWYPDCLPGEGPAHRVRITKPFWLGVTEVTQGQYQEVMGSNPSYLKGDPKRPVEQLTCDQAIEFCRRLSELPKEKAAQRQYRLPSEAQWEYACRAGSTGRWSVSDPAHPLARAAEEKLLEEYAWIGGGMTHPVGQKRANAWGLYDMYGNVMEWCLDWYEPHFYAGSLADDPTGPAEGTFRPCRGGSWFVPPRYSRSAFRYRHPTTAFRQDLGFRVMAVILESTTSRTSAGLRK